MVFYNYNDNQMKETIEFKLVGMCLPTKEFTLELPNQDTFKAKNGLNEGSFIGAFNYCKNNWSDNKSAIVSCSGLDNSGFPISPVVIEIKDLG